MPATLTPSERDDALDSLTGWSPADDGAAIRRRFEFPDFAAAFAFMTRVAALADAADHHPDWSNSYATVDIALSSHDAGGLTRRDVDLARAIDGVVAG